METYQPKDILIASLRGSVRHFHFHLVPLWEHEEKPWRMETLYEEGHLLEFLGFLEKNRTREALAERIEKDLSEEEQRNEITERLSPEIEKLRRISVYQCMPNGR